VCNRSIGLAALGAFLALPATLSAQNQNAPGSVCLDSTTTAATGKGACTGHGGVDHAATKKLHDANATPPSPPAPPTPPAPPAPPTPPAPNASPTTPTGTGTVNHQLANALAMCKDGWLWHDSNYTPHAGPCANRGGVAHWYPGSPLPCSDGTISTNIAANACAGHGGFNMKGTSPNPPPPPAPGATPTSTVNNDPWGAVAVCTDAWYWHAYDTPRADVCANHGGVAYWYP
jgi:hypothetical protein